LDKKYEIIKVLNEIAEKLNLSSETLSKGGKVE
jgi:hypothetical protein